METNLFIKIKPGGYISDNIYITAAICVITKTNQKLSDCH